MADEFGEEIDYGEVRDVRVWHFRWDDINKTLEFFLKQLPQKHEYILRETMMKDVELHKVGKKLGISRQRVAELRDRAIEMMRKLCDDYSLKERTPAVESERN